MRRKPWRDEEETCPECERANGPNYTGPCEHQENPREKDDDDGVEYADPRDEREERSKW